MRVLPEPEPVVVSPGPSFTRSSRLSQRSDRHSFSPIAGSLRHLASLLNSPSLRNVSVQPWSRQSSHDAVDVLYSNGGTVTMDELTYIQDLGEGGFATVALYSYKPRDPDKVKAGDGPGCPLVALKCMKSAPEAQRAHFQAEALLLKALRHPNVVACYGCVQPSPIKCHSVDLPDLMFLQEYCAGGTLLDKQLTGSYTALEALQWLADVAHGMAYLHMPRPGLCITHRDLKLENILLSDQGVAKVSDFGLSRLLPPVPVEPRTPRVTPVTPRAPVSMSKGGRDMTGQRGSALYMAPEVIMCEAYDHKVDVFSYGVVAFELLTHSRAYADMDLSEEALVASVVGVGGHALRPVPPRRWPPSVTKLVTTCWAHDASQRPEFGEVVSSLEALLEQARSTPLDEPNALLRRLAPLDNATPASACCTLQ